MTRRRKFMQQYSNQLTSSSQPSRQKQFSRKQRRRKRRQLRREQRRRRMQSRSRSIITQIAVDALSMLHISTESIMKPFEFIERYELTRQDALAMPGDQRPIVFFRESQNDPICSTVTHKLLTDLNEDDYSSYV